MELPAIAAMVYSGKQLLPEKIATDNGSGSHYYFLTSIFQQNCKITCHRITIIILP